MFLPTMPQDDLEDVREALLAARHQTGENPRQAGEEENPVFYRMFEHLYNFIIILFSLFLKLLKQKV